MRIDKSQLTEEDLNILINALEKTQEVKITFSGLITGVTIDKGWKCGEGGGFITPKTNRGFIDVLPTTDPKIKIEIFKKIVI